MPLIMRLPLSHGSSRRARGTMVVLPAPGGASRTAFLPVVRTCRISGITSSMGRFVLSSIDYQDSRFEDGVGSKFDNDPLGITEAQPPFLQVNGDLSTLP